MSRRPGPLQRRRLRRSMGSGAGPAPKLKRYRVPLADRLHAMLYRQRTSKPRRLRPLERLRARRASPVSRTPSRPVFRNRREQVMAGVVAGLVGFAGLAWYASRLPAPVGQATEIYEVPVPSPGETPAENPTATPTKRPGPSPDPGPQNSPLD